MIPYETIRLRACDLSLTGRLFLPWSSGADTRRPAVLFLHSYTSSQDANDVALAATLANDGFVCLTFDFAGHGVSEGDRAALTLADFLKQAICAYDDLAARPEVDPLRISVVGAGLGAYLTLLLTAKRPVAGVSLRVPSNYPDEALAINLNDYMTNGKTREFCARSLPYDATGSLRALRAFKGDVQIVEAGADEWIDPQTIANYVAAIRPPTTLDYSILPAAPHRVSQSPEAAEELRRRTRGWLMAHRTHEAVGTRNPPRAAHCSVRAFAGMCR
jgi:alpha-beta hydrolase superfamily lysophospholipase